MMRKIIECMFLVTAIVWAAMWTKIEDPPMGLLGAVTGFLVAISFAIRKD